MRLALSSLTALLALGFAATPAFAGDPEHKSASKHGEHHAELLKKFDANHDGKLDDSEKAAVRAAYGERLKSKHPELFKRIDTDNDGTLSQAEVKEAREKHKEHRAEMKKKFDTNGDGTLSAEEKAAAKAGFKEHHDHNKTK